MIRDLLTLGIAICAGSLALWAIHVERENRRLRRIVRALEGAVLAAIPVIIARTEALIPDEPVTTTESRAVH